MNKTELIAAIAEKAELSKKDAEAALNASVEAISEALAQGDKIQLIGFGSFEVKERAARVGRKGRDQDPCQQIPGVQGGQGPEGQSGRISEQRKAVPAGPGLPFF